jgi:hypothetical protein
VTVIDLDIGAYGFDEAERGLVRMVALLTDLRPFWPRLVPLFVTWMREQFGSEGDWGGEHWAPLTPAYAARKARLYPGKGILYATGDLRRHASLPRRVATPTSLRLIIDDPVASYHQEGTDRMPQRKIIPDELPTPAQAEVQTTAEEWIAEMATRLGL